jgi:hypothetical protein
VIQRLIGVSLGGLVTYVLLWWNNVDMAVAGTAVVVGAIASFFWPIVAGFILARRVKRRRDEQIQDEVARQVSAQNRG